MEVKLAILTLRYGYIVSTLCDTLCDYVILYNNISI